MRVHESHIYIGRFSKTCFKKINSLHGHLRGKNKYVFSIFVCLWPYICLFSIFVTSFLMFCEHTSFLLCWYLHCMRLIVSLFAYYMVRRKFNTIIKMSNLFWSLSIQCQTSITQHFE